MSSFDSHHSNNQGNYPKRRRDSHSEYQERPFSSIIFTNLPNMHGDDIYEELYDAFIHHKYFNIQVTSHHGQTVAYLNFEDERSASRAIKEATDTLCLFDGQVLVAPVIRGQRTQPIKIRAKSDSRRHKPTQQPRRRVTEPNEPCRVLFVGNLGPHVIAEDIEEVFSKYGYVENVSIRKNDDGMYGFVTFGDMDMAATAKRKAKDLRFGRLNCIIGYGKTIPSTCLFVGGVSKDGRAEVLREFDRFGRIINDFWPQGTDCCYIMFDKVSSAIDACRKMRGVELGKRTLRVDYARESHMKGEFADKCERFRCKEETPDKEEERIEIPPGSPVSVVIYEEGKVADDYSLSSISEDANNFFAKTLGQLRESDPVWEGAFSLKNSHVPVSMRFVQGKSEIVDYFMYKHSLFNGIISKEREPVTLSIVHRLKLDADKLGEVRRRIESSEGGYSVLLAFPTDSTLRSLKNYLVEKNAAGVVVISVSYFAGGVEKQSSAALHAFPKCDFAKELVSPVVSESSFDSYDDDFLTVLIVSNGLPPLMSSVNNSRSTA